MTGANCPGLQVGAGEADVGKGGTTNTRTWLHHCPLLGTGKGIRSHSSWDETRFQRKWLHWYLMVDHGLGGGASGGGSEGEAQSSFMFDFNLYLFILERREREKHLFVVPLFHMFIGCFLYGPCLGIEPTTLVYWDDALNN